MKLSFPAWIHEHECKPIEYVIDTIMGLKYCHKKWFEEVNARLPKPRAARHKKFSSIGNDLTADIFKGKTYKTDRLINKIAVHCAATPIGKNFDANDIDNMHLNRWGSNSGCGYHYIILRDGTIEKGRWADFSGAHVKGHNRNTLGVCYIGGVDRHFQPLEDSATPAQMKSLNALLKTLTTIYDLEPEKVLGHREFPKVAKACPCLSMDKVRADINN